MNDGRNRYLMTNALGAMALLGMAPIAPAESAPRSYEGELDPVPPGAEEADVLYMNRGPLDTDMDTLLQETSILIDERTPPRRTPPPRGETLEAKAARLMREFEAGQISREAYDAQIGAIAKRVRKNMKRLTDAGGPIVSITAKGTPHDHVI